MSGPIPSQEGRRGASALSKERPGSGGRPVLLDFSLVAPGGSTSHATGFLGALARKTPAAVDVLVALPAARSVLAPEEEALRTAGIRTVRIGSRRPAGTLASNIGAQAALPLLVRRMRPGVVFVPREVAPLLLPKPVVLVAANLLRWRPLDQLDLGATGSPGRPARALARLKSAVAAAVVGRAAAVVAPSQVIADVLPPGSSAHVIPFGVDLEGAGPGPSSLDARQPLRLLALGTVTRHKRIDVVIDLAADLAEHHDIEVTLDIWGGVPSAEERDRLVARLGSRLDGQGRLRGFLDPAKRRSVLVEADVLVLGSGTESFGFPMLEAMRTSTLVVAPDSPIGREIGGGSLVLYPEGDHREGARILAAWLEASRADEAKAILESARRRAQTFTWERCVDQTLDLLRTVAAGTPPRRSRQLAGEVP